MNDNTIKPPKSKSPLKSTEAGTNIMGTGTAALNSALQKTSIELKEPITPAEFKENQDIKNGLQPEDHRS
jgi:hypothetical protein